ncbi:MAG: sensor histidine kinase [Anaerolineae bacterium]
MTLRSIRWRLPLSYAGIALLTVACLGAVLLLTLRGYYIRREDEFLTASAVAISADVAPILASDAALSAAAAQVRSLAFLTQARVRVFDRTGSIVVDSGEQGSDVVYFAPMAAGTLTDAVPPPTGYFERLIGGETVSVMVVGTEGDRATPVAATAALPAQRGMSVVSTAYGFWLGDAEAAVAMRSDRVASAPVYAPAGDVVGAVELSQGPAFSREIVERVAIGWALASVVAVLAAGTVGWLISRRMSAPLLVLTESTARMASGDLSARAEVRQNDEFGDLATAFNHMAGRVEDTVVTLRRFAADAAHELHTPLTALRTDLELLAASAATAEAAPLVRRAQEQTERLQALTGGLMDLSRLEAGAPPADLTDIDLAALVRQACERHAARAEQAGLVLQLDVPDEPVPVRGRAADLERVLANLVDNATKFGQEGGEVSVRLRREGTWAVMLVGDRGIGIPEDELPHLFSRFHRARNASGYPGNGLGLAIVKAIVSSLGGEVAAVSAGGCTTFTVRLPLAQS